MQQKWPQNFGQDVVCTKAYGEMSAQRIYHAAVQRYQQDSDYQVGSTVICMHGIE
jgi:hypothetical protein